MFLSYAKHLPQKRVYFCVCCPLDAHVTAAGASFDVLSFFSEQERAKMTQMMGDGEKDAAACVRVRVCVYACVFCVLCFECVCACVCVSYAGCV